MSFHVGQKVVCVEPTILVPDLRMGDIYTVSEVGRIGIHSRRPIIKVAEAPYSYFASRFRPIVEPKTDISIFTAMLTPKKVAEPV